MLMSETARIARLHQMRASDGHDVASFSHHLASFVEEFEGIKPCREACRQDQ